MNSLPFAVRAIQLDLARHWEQPAFIREFAGRAAARRFNTLVLYLEGRVRTPAFPWPDPAESYSLDEMAAIAEYARGLGLDVVPATSTLAHAEQFLKFPHLRHLSEQRTGEGRFGPVTEYTEFCPSLPETLEFLGRYLSELAQAFPGPNLHLGLDEAFGLGFCPLCRARRQTEGLGSIVVRHLEQCAALARRLGKRPWIWDDLFELFPDLLARVPRDVVLCHWGYNENVEPDGQRAHFADRRKRDWLARYERLGFDALACPWDRHPLNIETFTGYARRRRVAGGLLTLWEGSPRLSPHADIAAAFTGRLWSRADFDPTAAWSETIGEVFPGAPRPLRVLLAEYFRYRPPTLQANAEAYLSGPLTREEKQAQGRLSALRAALEDWPDADDLPARVRWHARADALYYDLRDLAPAIFDPCLASGDERWLLGLLDRARAEVKALRVERSARAAAWRLEETSFDRTCRDAVPLEALGRELAAWAERLARPPGEREGLLILRLFLHDFFGAPRLTVRVAGGGRESTIADGCFKNAALNGNQDGGAYEIARPFACDFQPESVRIEGGGYGGQGVGYIELRHAGRVLRPARLLGWEGPVERPEAVLTDDSSFCLLGLRDTLAAMHDPSIGAARGRLDVALAPEDP